MHVVFDALLMKCAKFSILFFWIPYPLTGCLVIQEYLGPEILSHYVLHGKVVAETVKQLLVHIKKHSKLDELSSIYSDAMKRVPRLSPFNSMAHIPLPSGISSNLHPDLWIALHDESFCAEAQQWILTSSGTL